ncbi:hypothetical protein ACN22W_17505 [Burkholderia theae]|uniref:hypothetical protein n=1 Tax=Burkholderia theae TaxID=3143496 RepID=UPI003AFA4799
MSTIHELLGDPYQLDADDNLIEDAEQDARRASPLRNTRRATDLSDTCRADHAGLIALRFGSSILHRHACRSTHPDHHPHQSQ